jgi:hypothetical protein
MTFANSSGDCSPSEETSGVSVPLRCRIICSKNYLASPVSHRLWV